MTRSGAALGVTAVLAAALGVLFRGVDPAFKLRFRSTFRYRRYVELLRMPAAARF